MTYMQSQIMFLQPDINGFYSASRLSIVILSPQKNKIKKKNTKDNPRLIFSPTEHSIFSKSNLQYNYHKPNQP